MFCIHMNCIMFDIPSSCRKSYSCWLFQSTILSRGITVMGNELGLAQRAFGRGASQLESLRP